MPEQEKNSPLPNPNQGVNDMFAEVDKATAAAPTAGAPVQPTPMPSQPAPSAGFPTAGPGNKKKIIIIAVAAIVVLGLIGFLGYKFMSAPEPAAPVVDQPEEVEPAPEAEFAPKVEVKEAEKKIIIEDDIVLPEYDSDSDGLTDSEEKELGTNFLQIDSDGDGLFDFNEVKVYFTDPLNPDTDGDSFLDGEEVLKGYNPKGEGKLLNLEEALKNAQQ